MKLTKHHGLGNDFLITWADEVPADAGALARRLCDRRTGIGADGLIFGVGDHPVGFVLFNADGSSAEVSGNGLRCFGQALAIAEGVDVLDVTVSTEAGPRRISVLGPDTTAAGSASTVDVEVDMGSAGDGPALTAIDLTRYLDTERAESIDMGNPHVVLAVADPMAHDMADVGPKVEADFMPSGINVHLVASRPDGIAMNIWERGAGVTQACGSGACAAAIAAHRWGWVTGDKVRVHMPGGEALVTVGPGEAVRLRGPAVFVATIDIPIGDSSTNSGPS